MKRFFAATCLTLVLIFVAACSPGIGRPNTTVVDFHSYFSLDPRTTQLVLDGRRLTDTRLPVPQLSPLVEYRGGLPRVYLPVGFLREHVDPFIFWDEGAGALFVSTLYEMLEFSPDSDHFLRNGSPNPIDNPIIMRDDVVFVPESLVHGLYSVIVEYFYEYNIVVITTANAPQTTATVSASRADVRYWGGIHSPIAAQPAQDEELVLFLDFEADSEQETDRDFVRVRTSNGLLGYVHTSEIGEPATATPIDMLRRNTVLDGFVDNFAFHSRTWQGIGPINLVWEVVYHPAAKSNLMQTPLDSGLTVVSPTWFRIDESAVRLNSVASREYVDWAHAQGMEVWPLVFDVNHARSRAFLQSREARQYAIAQLIEYVELLNLCGINIDFEHLMFHNEGPYKLQFLRELAIPMRQRGVVLSAAVKTPHPSNMFYRRDLIARTVDFVMVMAYDEHYATKGVAGPNASLPWVRAAVANSLEEVPAERLVLGLPFYNRIWRENRRTGEVSHYRALGTNSTRAFFEERNVMWEWNEELGVYYGNVAAVYYGETVNFRVWLECSRSMQEKMNVFSANNLAGVASWSRLFAIDEFWDVLRRYF